jgi:hypothetical protein
MPRIQDAFSTPQNWRKLASIRHSVAGAFLVRQLRHAAAKCPPLPDADVSSGKSCLTLDFGIAGEIQAGELPHS